MIDVRVRNDVLQQSVEQRRVAVLAAAAVRPHRRAEVLSDVDGVRHVRLVLVVEHDAHVHVVDGFRQHAADVRILRVPVDQLQPTQRHGRRTDVRSRIGTYEAIDAIKLILQGCLYGWLSLDNHMRCVIIPFRCYSPGPLAGTRWIGSGIVL